MALRIPESLTAPSRASSPRTLALFGLGAAVFALGKLYDGVRALRWSFRGKVVLVTGGSRGLGLVLARKLAARGAKLVLVARDAEALARARHELERRWNADVLDVPCDVANGDDVLALLALVRERFGGVDALINGAGTIHVGPLATLSLDDFRRAMDTHFFGPLHLTLGAIDDMRARGGGRIVNVASIGGLVAVPHLATYTASKHALVGLSDALRSELASAGVRVTTVCPGLMRTGSPKNATFLGDAAAEHAWFEVSDSLPLISMSAERAADAILSACARGAPLLRLGWTTKLAALGSALFPATTARALAILARLLPGVPEHPSTGELGRDADSGWTRGWLTAASRRAAARNNERIRPAHPAPNDARARRG